jgi:hypothetical protein
MSRPGAAFSQLSNTYGNSDACAVTAIARHVSSGVVFEEFENQPPGERLFWTYKLEGMTIRNANVVEIINDNDFGTVGGPANPPPTNLWSVRLSEQLPSDK